LTLSALICPQVVTGYKESEIRMSEPSTDVRPESAEVEVDAESVIAAAQEAMIESELLVEDVSIDGMCGVY